MTRSEIKDFINIKDSERFNHIIVLKNIKKHKVN